MNKNSNVREAALDALLKIEKNQAYSNLLLNDIINKKSLSAIDVPLFTQIVYGTIQQKKKLDFILESYSKKPLEKLESWVVTLLRLSLFQLMFLDRVPDHAVLNEAVNIAKKRGHKGIAGLVNGMLRTYLREGSPSFEAIKDPVKRLAVETSHPEWMIARWTKHYGREQAAAIAEANNEAPVTSVRINEISAKKSSVIKELEAEGLSVEESPLLSNALRVRNGSAAATAAFREGRISIQDEGSMLVGMAVSPQKGETILDSCAAPGGKTTHIAELLNNTGTVYSMDLHDHKVKLISEQVQRLHLNNVITQTGDARKVEDLPLFDRILIDAPCSGLGVIQRKPDMKWSKKEEDITRLVQIQADIMDHIWKFLKPGGELIYSTCTIDYEENDSQINRFLEAHKDAAPNLKLMEKFPANLVEHFDSKNTLQLLPGKYGTDGFFIASLLKTSE
ncbi:16S rRNA (cytosine(967)-C(5))-methyltransferase RsmB [Alkalicoccus daliensis]|uniref:16S rRNA (cytosine(967)-C(5))-methyltransferase n=1 Tax=Alkalicoccus daliensis TaxID=745820 RepID=A0A1G9ZY90_9BACI|nr:16S rRNA (cytosine(967)-C(5))-methyltransferase RsmB [Alkalicoccus daliensis]SDN26280.1 16S rRNA (cytosine967-C5)-methyltransferase [Alkalicoccus daliensis]